MKIYAQKLATSFFLLVGITMTSNVFAEDKAEANSLMMAETDIAGNLIQTGVGLLLILALIVGAAWLARRFGNFKMAAQGQMKIVAGLSLGTKERVVLLEVGDEQLLIGVAPGRIQTLHVLDNPLQSNESASVPQGFAEKLGAAMGRPSAKS